MNANPAPPICIHCGLSAGSPPRLNRLEDGRLCPACAERLLDALPPLLPASEDLAQALSDGDEAGDDYADYDSADRDRPA